ncbi:hypothetical protein FHW03_005298, partial [Ochrobactrum sp. RH2CCR150]|nr:hypothetical protein [Ochrobactrum sp. RH2CCR150]
FAYEWLSGIPAALSHKPGKFQLSVVQIRGAPHRRDGLYQNLEEVSGLRSQIKDVIT